MEEKRSLQSIPDDELLQRLAELTGQSRRVEVDVVAHIAEVDERKLYAREAFPSMFFYCKDALHLSEQEAYLRIAVARASRKHPMLLTMLSDGRLHLTAISKLAPHLTRENRDRLLKRATHQSKRQLEELIAEIAPRPDVPVVVRKLPERRALPTAGPAVPNRAKGSMPELDPEPTLGLRPDPMDQLGPDRAPESGARRDDETLCRYALPADVLSPEAFTALASPHASAPPASPSVVQPLSPGRYKVQFTASAEFQQKLERLRALVGSNAGNGGLAAVIEQAVSEKLERLEARRFALKRAPRKVIAEANRSTSPRHTRGDSEQRPDPSPSSRHIPAAVRRAVYQRDGGRCRYVDEQGRRCPERHRLEFHHGHPFGLGGTHSVANVCLMCRAHNAYMAECDYGKQAMASQRRPRKRVSPATMGEYSER